jgi:hypothetical protein
MERSFHDVQSSGEFHEIARLFANYPILSLEGNSFLMHFRLESFSGGDSERRDN